MSVTVPASDQTVPAEPKPSEATPLPLADNHAARSAKLKVGALSVYGSGALVENITTFAIGGLLLFYLTVVCGLSGTQAGFALGATLVVDAIFDPVVGSVSDNSRSRHGRRHPFMLAAIVPVVVTFGMLFSAPRGLSGNLLFAYALTILLTLRIAYSCFVVPYMALGAELTDDYAERSTIVASRVLFTVGGGLLANYLAFGVFLKGAHGRWDAAAYSPLAWSMGAIILTGGLLSAFGTLRTRGRLHMAAAGARFSPDKFLVELVEVFRNRSFRTLFLCCLILFAALGAAGALTLHANTFFWKLSATQILIIGFVAPVGVLGGVFVAAGLARWIEKRWIAMLGLGLIGVAQLAPVALRLAHLIGPPLYVPILAFATILGGLGGSVATISFQSMMADATDEHEHLFGARREGLYFAGITFSAKAASGLGALIGGVALDVIGFPHGAAATPAMLASIPATTIRNLGITYGPGAALFTTVSVVILLGYKLTKPDHARILDDLKQRRADKASA
jgi:GPH family glycoside/pentoside/hexuronide:cation symporter